MPKFQGLSLTIGAKLIGLIASLLMGSVVTLVWISTAMFVDNNTLLIKKANSDFAANQAGQAREIFENLIDKMRVLGTGLLEEQNAQQSTMLKEFFTKDKDLLTVFLLRPAADGSLEVQARATSPELVVIGDPDGEKAWTGIRADRDFSQVEMAQGSPQVSILRLADGSSSIVVGIPFVEKDKGFSHFLMAIVRQNTFVKAFSESDLVTSFLVDRKGRLFAHPDEARVTSGENVSFLPIVKQMMDGKSNNQQMRYVDPQTGEARLGAFKMIGFGGLGVVSESSEAKALDVARKVRYRSAVLALAILSIAFLAGYFYSGTITWPIKQLVAAAGRISSGDFKIDLKPKGRDEVARLSVAFNEMARGLEERDKVKEVFNKFHNKEIANKLLSGEVKLGGERREAVVFFSDVRGFTAMSEAMQPEEVVEMLNEYMSSMVTIILKYGGVVDKYVGDAIMALWGVPLGKPEDAWNAVRASLAMREELAMLNELRKLRGQAVLKIGMGLNLGPVIAGNIGSNDKMEYTVIGDTVNLASRIESMTKHFGTDLLISKNLLDRIEGRFIVEPCESAYVKGKAEAIQIYKVRGFVDADGNSILIETPYSSYAAEKSDKAGHAPSAESKETQHAVEVEDPTGSLYLNNKKNVA